MIIETNMQQVIFLTGLMIVESILVVVSYLSMREALVNTLVIGGSYMTLQLLWRLM